MWVATLELRETDLMIIDSVLMAFASPRSIRVAKKLGRAKQTNEPFVKRITLTDKEAKLVETLLRDFASPATAHIAAEISNVKRHHVQLHAEKARG